MCYEVGDGEPRNRPEGDVEKVVEKYSRKSAIWNYEDGK